MKVYFIGAGPGDPELVTLKAVRLLGQCRVCVYSGSLINPAILAYLPEGAERHDSARMNLGEIAEVFRRAWDGQLDVARLHPGDPSIYGAIQEQMRALDGLSIPYEVVPGVSSFQAAAAALGVELTAPEISQTIILTRTAGRTPIPSHQELSELARCRATYCVFLSVHKIEEVAAALAPELGADCPAAVVYRASWPDQRTIRGTLADIAAQSREAGLERTALILVGWSLAGDAPPSRLYDAGFSHGFRERVRE